jgi:hypothetical protein
MIMRLSSLACLTLLISCSSLEPTPFHTVLGSDRGWRISGLQILLDAQIDKLRVRRVRIPDNDCVVGYREHLEIAGEIGPDSTAAIARLLPQLSRCNNVHTGVHVVNAVYLSSGGGYLSDGYALGELFKKYSVQTVVDNQQICASSCAIAFLGGRFRTMSGSAKLMFHAPYIGNRLAIDCTDRGQVSELRNYYESVLGENDANFLLDRTLSYCSASSGWTLNADGAKLFGLTSL